jgi:hypothetical protein
MGKVPGTAWSDEQIGDVLRRLAARETKADIARAYGVTPRAINHMLGSRRAQEMADPIVLRYHGPAPVETERPTPPNPFPWIPGGHVERVTEQAGPFVAFPGMRPVHDPDSFMCREQAPKVNTRDTVPSAGPVGATGDPTKDPACHALGAPDLYHLRGVSTLLGKDGRPVQQWVKTARDADHDLLPWMHEAIKGLPDAWFLSHKPQPHPLTADADRLAMYPIVDAHFGMYAWANETGTDYDTDIAERLHVEAIAELVDNSVPADLAVVPILGDLVHCDSNNARTARAGNQLDTDTRLQKVARVALNTTCAVVHTCLRRHKRVHVVLCPGNHDPLAAMFLGLGVEAFFRNDPRVTVDKSADVFRWLRFGANLFGFTHGDGPKLEELPLLMAQKRSEDWGATKHRRWLTGHIHHQKVHEIKGVYVEALGTLAPTDAWAHGMGYHANRVIRVDFYHREQGRKGYYETTIEPRATS